MRKKRCDAVDLERLLLDLQSPDEAVRAKAVRSLCPCHAGWEGFEQLFSVVSQLMQDTSPTVRAHALHVYQDAVKIQSIEDSAYRLETVEEELRQKRASRFGDKVAEFEVKRSGMVKRRRGSFVVR
jgi:uncharacterized membrane protein